METNQNATPEAVVSPTQNPLSAATIPTLGSPSSGTSPPSVTPIAPPEVGGDHGSDGDNGGGTTITNPVVNGTPPAATSAPPTVPSPTAGLSEAVAGTLLQQTLALNDALAAYLLPTVSGKQPAQQRPRIGLEAQVPMLVELAEQLNIAWAGYPLSQFATDVAAVAALQAIAGPIAALGKQLSTTILQKRTTYQRAMQGIYSQLQVRAEVDPALAETLLPIARVLAPGKGKTRKPKAQPAPASSSGASAGTTSASPSQTTIAAPAQSGAAVNYRPVERRRFVRTEHRA